MTLWFILPRATHKHRWFLLCIMIWKLNWRENNRKQIIFSTVTQTAMYIQIWKLMYERLIKVRILQLSSRPLDGDAALVWHLHYFNSHPWSSTTLFSGTSRNYGKSILSQSGRSIRYFEGSKVESCRAVNGVLNTAECYYWCILR